MSDLVFNGPAEFNMEVFVFNDETKATGKVTVGLGVFEYPTPARIAARLEKLQAEEFTGALKGFRLMGKREAWDTVMLEKAGERFALVGGSDWDALPHA
jgi:hypothetical protein